MKINLDKQKEIVSWEYCGKEIKILFPNLYSAELRDDNIVIISTDGLKKNYIKMFFELTGEKILEVNLSTNNEGVFDGFFQWEYGNKTYKRSIYCGQVNYYKNYDMILWLDRRKSELNCIKGITRNNEIKFACSGPNNAQPLNLNYSSTVKPKISFWPVDKNKDSGWYYFNPDTLEYEFICITR